MYSKETITKSVNIIKEDRNMSIQEMVDALGTARISFKKILRGDGYPSVDLLYRIFNAYPEYSIDWFFTGEGGPRKIDNSAINEKMEMQEDKIKNLQEMISILKDLLEVYRLKFGDLRK